MKKVFVFLACFFAHLTAMEQTEKGFKVITSDHQEFMISNDYARMLERLNLALKISENPLVLHHTTGEGFTKILTALHAVYEAYMLIITQETGGNRKPSEEQFLEEQKKLLEQNERDEEILRYIFVSYKNEIYGEKNGWLKAGGYTENHVGFSWYEFELMDQNGRGVEAWPIIVLEKLCLPGLLNQFLDERQTSKIKPSQFLKRLYEKRKPELLENKKKNQRYWTLVELIKTLDQLVQQI